MSKQITVFILKAYNIRKRDFMLVGATGFIRFSGRNLPPGGLLPLGLCHNAGHFRNGYFFMFL